MLRFNAFCRARVLFPGETAVRGGLKVMPLHARGYCPWVWTIKNMRSHMGAPTKFDFAFGRSLRRGAGKIGCLIDVAFGFIGFASCWSFCMEPRIDDWGNVTPSVIEADGLLAAIGLSLFCGWAMFILAFLWHSGVIYLRHMWTSPAGRAAIVIITLPMVFVLLSGNILVFLLLAAAYPMLARWIMPLVGLFTGWLFSEGDPSDTAADSLDKDSFEE